MGGLIRHKLLFIKSVAIKMSRATTFPLDVRERDDREIRIATEKVLMDPQSDRVPCLKCWACLPACLDRDVKRR